MTQNTVYHTNKLIAEFMGYKPNTPEDDRYFNMPDRYHHYDGLNYQISNTCTPDSMQFHSSWDWLMPVVEKIYQTGISGGMMDDYQAALASADIGRVYAEVVKFIKWFNNR